MPFSLPIPIDMTWAAVAAPHPLPAHSNSFDNIYVFQFSCLSSFSFSFIQMNCRTRSSIRDGRRARRRIGEKIREHFIGIGRTRTYEKHPENFMVLGVPVSPLILSHQNHPICTFRNHRIWSDIVSLTRTRWWRGACWRGRRGPGSRP